MKFGIASRLSVLLAVVVTVTAGVTAYSAYDVSRDLLEDFLEECEEAIDWLETQQDLIESVTLPNYLQAHMGSAED